MTTGEQYDTIELTSGHATRGARGHYALPAPTMLLAFEAAVRLCGFKAAAEELGVTPGAISHQIKSLERDLGVPLFVRRHRGVEATGPALALARVLADGYARTARMLGEIRRDAAGSAVSITATTAVSSLWLTPRLTRFWKAHPGIAVDQHVSDTPVAPRMAVDLRLVYGRDGPDGIELFRDVLVPLCSPAFASDHPDRSLAALAEMPLLHLEAASRQWTDWPTWFREQGGAPPVKSGRRVNNYTIALQCAADDAGVVLGWRRLVAPLIERGDLVVFGPHAMPAPHGFHVCHAPESELSIAARTLRDWLVASIAAGTGSADDEENLEPRARDGSDGTSISH